MAAYPSELKQVLLSYINGENVLDRLKMKKVLQTTSVEVRCRALMSVKGNYHWTAVHRGASSCDVESMKYMMEGFTSDQRYNIVKRQSSVGSTALHYAAAYNKDDATAVAYLLNNLSREQRYNLLRIQGNATDTALHVAAITKHKSVLQAMLSSVSPEQQKKLLNIKNMEGKTIADIISSAELFNIITATTVLELQESQVRLQERLERNEKQTEKIGGELEQLKKNSQDKDRQITELAAKATTHEKEMQQMKQRLEELMGPKDDDRDGENNPMPFDQPEQKEPNEQLTALEGRHTDLSGRVDGHDLTIQSTREDLAKFSHRVEDLEENVVYKEVPIGGHQQPAGEFLPLEEEEEAEEHDQ